MKTVALIVAAGASVRFGGETPKQFRGICGRPMLSWTISRFEAARRIDQIILVVGEEHLLFAAERVVSPYGFDKVSRTIIGGETRRQSVRSGLEALPISTNYVAIHDGARPLVSAEDIDRVVEAAVGERAAILATRTTDTVKRVKQGFVLTTLKRDSLYLAQTPQVFQYDLIVNAHRECDEKSRGETVTDDASLLEARGFKVIVVEPSSPNFKVTTQEDLLLAEAILRREGHE